MRYTDCHCILLYIIVFQFVTKYDVYNVKNVRSSASILYVDDGCSLCSSNVAGVRPFLLWLLWLVVIILLVDNLLFRHQNGSRRSTAKSRNIHIMRNQRDVECVEQVGNGEGVSLFPADRWVVWDSVSHQRGLVGAPPMTYFAKF